MDLYQQILKSYFVESKDDRLATIEKDPASLEKNKARTNKAMQMMLDGEIDFSEYKTIKSRYDVINTA